MYTVYKSTLLLISNFNKYKLLEFFQIIEQYYIVNTIKGLNAVN